MLQAHLQAEHRFKCAGQSLRKCQVHARPFALERLWKLTLCRPASLLAVMLCCTAYVPSSGLPLHSYGTCSKETTESRPAISLTRTCLCGRIEGTSKLRCIGIWQPRLPDVQARADRKLWRQSCMVTTVLDSTCSAPQLSCNARHRDNSTIARGRCPMIVYRFKLKVASSDDASSSTHTHPWSIPSQLTRISPPQSSTPHLLMLG